MTGMRWRAAAVAAGIAVSAAAPILAATAPPVETAKADAPPPASPPPGSPSPDYATKANYLVRLAPFITWPATAFAAATAPVTICVVGDDPFQAAIDDAVRGQSVAGRALAVRRLPAPDAGCHLMFARAATALPAPAAEAPILTVTDDGSGAGRAMIRFITRNGKVRFIIDAAALNASGLTASSKLLGLAVAADGDP